jgi:glycosyltransferase involved in cell wall biosynthesis
VRHVVTIVNSLNRGGAESSVIQLAEATKENFRHTIVTLLDGGPLEEQAKAKGITVISMGMKRSQFPGTTALKLVKTIRGLAPDLIVACMYHSALAAAFYGKITFGRTPQIWSIHHSLHDIASEGISTRLALKACRLLANSASKIVYVSGKSADHHRKFGFPQDRSMVIPNGYDLERFQPLEAARKRLRAELGFDDSAIVVGHVARVDPIKDHPMLIAAMDGAMRQNPRVALLLCGKGTDELEIPASMKDRTRALGERSDVSDIMNACDIGVLSSKSEAFPNVLSEFLACEKPCITTDVGDAATIVGESGLVVPPRSTEAFSKAMVDMAGKPEDERRRLGRLGRLSINARFSIQTVAQQNMDLWKATIEKA